jgi:hypothetical protein
VTIGGTAISIHSSRGRSWWALAGEAQILIELVETLFEDWYVARHKRTQRFASVKALAEGKKKEIAEAKQKGPACAISLIAVAQDQPACVGWYWLSTTSNVQHGVCPRTTITSRVTISAAVTYPTCLRYRCNSGCAARRYSSWRLQRGPVSSWRDRRNSARSSPGSPSRSPDSVRNSSYS